MLVIRGKLCRTFENVLKYAALYFRKLCRKSAEKIKINIYKKYKYI